MPTQLRRTMLVVAVFQALTAVLLFVHPGFVLDDWPFDGSTDLTFIFLASIAAAAAASLAWSCLSGETGSLAGIGLDGVAILWPLIAWLLLLDPELGGGPTTFLGLLLVTALFFTWMAAYALPAPIRDPRPTPRPVLVAFAVFVVLLVLVAVLLLAGTKDVVPWRLTRELSALAGLVFLGAAAYFGYGLLRPSWANAGGQLAGFLAYDLVLVVPFLTRLPGISSEWLPSMVGYLTVLVSSGLLAAWYLFVAPATRITRPR